MPIITFRLLSTAEQLAEIQNDFQAMIDTLEDSLDADLETNTDLVPDPELETTWIELFGESGGERGSELKVDVRRYDLGSISGLTMHFAHILTEIKDEPAEPLLREVKDDPGTPRVPWHVEVTP